MILNEPLLSDDCYVPLLPPRHAQQEALALKVENDLLKRQLAELQLQLAGGGGGPEKQDSGDEAASVNTGLVDRLAGTEHNQQQLIQTITE